MQPAERVMIKRGMHQHSPFNLREGKVRIIVELARKISRRARKTRAVPQSVTLVVGFTDFLENDRYL